MWLNPELRPKRRRHPKRIFLNVYPELAILNVYPELRPKRRRHPKRIYCASFLYICSASLVYFMISLHLLITSSFIS